MCEESGALKIMWANETFAQFAQIFFINKLYVGGRHDMPPPRPASGDTIYVMYAYG